MIILVTIYMSPSSTTNCNKLWMNNCRRRINSINMRRSPSPTWDHQSTEKNLKEPSSFHWQAQSELAPSNGCGKLPPPPALQASSSSPNLQYGIHVPIPPCPLNLSPRSSSRRRMMKSWEDPFLAAYIECTKSGELSTPRRSGSRKDLKKDAKMVVGFFSCKTSCMVREDSLVKVVHRPDLRRRTRLPAAKIYDLGS